MDKSESAIRIGLHSNEQQRGVGLIEVLLTLVVLSIGFLTAANMQIRSLKTNQDAHFQSQATLLISDMMDRMRSNPAGVDAGGYDGKNTGSSAAPDCVSKTCTEAEIAALDLYEWSANFENLRGDPDFLPALPKNNAGDPAKGTISTPADGVYTVSLTWAETVDSTDTTRTISVEFAP